MILKEAKQKEKRQIKEAYNTGVWDVGCRNSDSEQYYNENFNIK
jgi:N12 class adenine-specific DNA methylase